MDWLHEAIEAEAAAAPEPPAAVPVVAGRVVHIDADYLAYFAAGGDEMPVGIARRVAAERLEAFREISGSSRAVVHLTMSGSTKGERFLAATVKDYQGHRAGKKPKNWAALRDYLENSEYFKHERAKWRDREADDGVALASALSADPTNEVVIATKDKDFRMLPGIHVCWDSYTETVVPPGAYEVLGEIGPADKREQVVFGQKWFWLQLLQGDTADNIPGVPRFYGKKCGDATAMKALAGTTCNAEAFDVVSHAYHDYYGKGWSDRLAEQACLLWLRTDSAASPDNFLSIVPIPLAGARLLKRIATQRSELDKINGIHARTAAQEDGCGAGQ